MRLLKTTVSSVEGGALLVEISIADTSDIATAQESALVRVILEPNPHLMFLEEIQFAALKRIRTELDEHISELDKLSRKARRP